MRTRFVSVLATLGAVVAAHGHADTKVLSGDFEKPLCEASAALRLPCGEGQCLFVGDNEVRDRLYRFPIENRDLETQDAKELILSGVEISDIEALVDLGSHRVLVLGSHSRNKRCDPKKKRRRFLVVERSEDGIEPVGETVQGKKIKCERLFGDVAGGSDTLQAVCKRIDEAEAQADAIFAALDTKGRAATEEACGKAAPFNIEGAASIPAATGSRVWVGLRGPLVERETNGKSRKLGVMLRMSDLERLHFDAAALIDLNGFAIRELAVAGDWVWAIGGPPEDSDTAFNLWRFPVGSLQPDATIQPESVAELPTSSEGLAVSGSTAFVVIDGDADACAEHPARYQVVQVPKD